MSSSKFPTGFALLWALAGGLICAGPVLAQDEPTALERAIELFDAQDYLAAQEALLAIDRSALNAEQEALLNDYLNRVRVANTMNEKALRDLEDAETALAEGEVEEARRRLSAVLANEYAAQALRQAATAHLRELGGEEEGETAPAPQPEEATEQPATEPAPPPEEATEQPATEPAPVATAPAISPVDAQRARVLTEEAHEMVRTGQYNEARRLYEDALALVPGYPEAIDGLQRVREHERNVAGARDQTLIDRIRSEDRINWQRTVAEYRDSERVIRQHVAAERFDEAQQMVIRAGQVVEAGRQFADPVTKYESLRGEFGALKAFVDTEERDYHERKVAEVRREVERQRKKHLQEIEERRARQVETLMKQAVQHRKDGDLDAAINVLEQVRIIDPQYQPARWMADDLEDLRGYRRHREVRQDFYEQSRKALIDVDEAKIPWHDLLRYPKNWAEVIARPTRRGTGQAGPGSQLLGALDQRIRIDFHDEPFDQVIERLADANQLNIIVNWSDLQRAGLERQTPIDLSLPREITLKKALTEVLEQAGGGLVKVGYEVADDTIKVATRATLDKQTYTAVYDINDLLMEIPMFNDGPMTDLSRSITRHQAEQADQPWRYGDDDDDEPEEDPERTGRVQKIIDLIEETVAPDSWYDRGGSIGTIREINGQLVITQNSAALQQIGDLLGKLREQRAIQIAIEARFVTVTSHYLEELGVDIDLVLNAGNAGMDFIPAGTVPLRDPVLGNSLLLPRQYSRLGFSPAVPVGLGVNLQQNPVGGQLSQPFGQPQLVPQRTGGSGSELTPVPIINRVLDFTDPANLGSDVPGSFAGQTIGPAFALFGSFLDNIQVDFLLRATQADSRTTILTAPRLVLFNGQRSWVAVTVQQNYVSQLQPVVATGAVAQQPTTAVVDSGAVLDVTATVTADRRYVTMTLRPGVTRLLDMQTIPFSGGGAGGGFGGGTALPAFIQLPTLSAQRVATTVSVPDGGTLLIGGQKLASETEVEAGVPVLSKIPFLKRLYQARTMVKDEQTLLILVKPKVLIHSEEEDLAFPSFRQG